MRRLALLAAMALAAPAHADPAAAYLEARDAAIAGLKALKDDPTVDAREARARAGLAKRLAAFLPPPQTAGFGATPEMSPQTLIEELGFGTLDGLIYTSERAKARVLVTSTALLRAWLAARPRAGVQSLPIDPDVAIGDDSFYTFAISPDASVDRFADIPVAVPGATVRAFLALRRQDIGAGFPDEVDGTLIRGGRVFVVTLALDAPLATPACEAGRQADAARDAALLQTYADTGAKDKALFARLQKQEADGDARYRRCYAERVVRLPAYAGLVRRVQAVFAGLR